MALSADPRIGTRLLGYEIEAILGRGGMGDVYKAYDPRLKRYIALKLLPPGLAEDTGFRERFLRESELAASLDHPSIVPIYDAGEVGGQLYIAMRYVEGTDLKALIREDGALAPARAVALLAQLADALDTAHERGLVHRDVKPSNALLDAAGHLYLADFGLTQSTSDRSEPTGTGQIVGTVDYVAPEQIEGEETDGRADLYSLGCLLYECLTGEVPFPRDTELAVLWAHLYEPPPRPSEHNPALSRAVDTVLAKAMAKSPDERHASCAELVEEAREALGLREIVLVRDRRPLLMVSAGLLLAVCSGDRRLPGQPGRRGTCEAEYETDARAHGRRAAADRPEDEQARRHAQARLGPDGSRRRRGLHLDDSPRRQQDLQGRPALERSRRDELRSRPAGGRSRRTLGVGRQRRRRHGNAARSALGSSDPRTCRSPESTQLVAFGSGAVWVASPLTGIVAQVNPRSSSMSGSSDVAARRGALKAVAVGEGAVWISSNDIVADQYRVFRIDPASGKVVERIRLRLGAWGIGAGGGAVWVANPLGDTVSQIEVSTNRVVRTIRVGRDPIAVAVGEGAVWVTNYKDGTVSRIDPKRGRVVATIRVGPNPDHVAAGEGGVWVTVHPR